MTLWQMYTLVELIVNKDFSGGIITPKKFNELIKVVNIDMYRKKYGLPEEYQPGRPVPNEYIDVTLKNTDDMKAFKVFVPNTPVTGGILPFPANYAHRVSVKYNYVKTINSVATTLPREVEILKEDQFTNREGNYTKRPTTYYPIGTIRSDGIHIRPTAISLVDFSYLRFPVDPEFAYVQNTGFITYNAPASTEYEWPADEGPTLVAMILKYVGVNLREAEIVQIANQQIQTGK